jgi:hypothetical protein
MMKPAALDAVASSGALISAIGRLKATIKIPGYREIRANGRVAENATFACRY